MIVWTRIFCFCFIVSLCHAESSKVTPVLPEGLSEHQFMFVREGENPLIQIPHGELAEYIRLHC